MIQASADDPWERPIVSAQEAEKGISVQHPLSLLSLRSVRIFFVQARAAFVWQAAASSG